MKIAGIIILVLFYCLAPAGVLWLCRKVKWIGKIGPILMLYFIGAIIANIGIFPAGEPVNWLQKLFAGAPKVQDLLSSAMIPLAIPLMLFSFTFRKSETRDTLIAMVTGLAAVVIAVVAGYPLFSGHINDAPRVAGMYTACLTGGTVNMASVSTALGVEGQQYALLNTYDMIVSFTYLVFIMAFGIRLARKILPVKTLDYNEAAIQAELEKSGANPYKGIFEWKGFKDVLALIGVTILIVAVSAGVAFGLSKLLPGHS